MLQGLIQQAEKEKIRIDTKLAEAKERAAPKEEQEAIASSYKEQADWARSAQEAVKNLFLEQQSDRKIWINKMFDIIHEPQYTLNSLLYELRKEIYLKTDQDNDRNMFMQQYKDMESLARNTVNKIFPS